MTDETSKQQEPENATLEPIVKDSLPVESTVEAQDNEITLSLSSEAKQKNCTVEKENDSPAFNIACDGEIGDKIHFTLLSTICADKEEKAQLGYPKKSYIKCP